MTERIPFRILLQSWLAYSGLMCALLIFSVVPHEIWPRQFPGPDLMVVFTFIWLVLRPRLIPTPLIAAVFFFADILLMRPIGLWAALMVVAAEFFRNRRAGVRGQVFATEWAMVSGVVLTLTIANAAILYVVFLSQVQFDKAMIQAISTILAYPLFAVAARRVFGTGSVTSVGRNATELAR